METTEEKREIGLDDLISIKDASRLTGVCERTLRNLVSSRELTAYKPAKYSKVMVFLKSDLTRYFTAYRSPAKRAKEAIL